MILIYLCLENIEFLNFSNNEMNQKMLLNVSAFSKEWNVTIKDKITHINPHQGEGKREMAVVVGEEGWKWKYFSWCPIFLKIFLRDNNKIQFLEPKV